MLKNILLVGLGGAIGSSLRYGVALMFKNNNAMNSAFPWSTFSVNLIGCLCLGLIMGLIYKSTDDLMTSSLMLFLGIGLMGGFTTFSTFSIDSIRLFQDGHNVLALVYVLLSNIFGIALGYFGLKIAHYL